MLMMGVESSQVMDCLQLRQSAPFHYLISEQAKSLVALQELQHEVGALLEFRDLVIETFPNLRSKMGSSTPTTMTTTHSSSSSNIPVAVRRDWEPGVRVRRKLNTSKEERSKKTESTIQDSGFSTETSSKETHSSSAMTTTAMNVESEDELWNLLDVIHRKGTRLKNEVEALQGALQNNLPAQQQQQEEPNFQRTLFHASSADDIRQLKRERDLLLDRVAEMEAEVIAASRLQEDFENLLATKHDLEKQLKAVCSQRGEINSRIRDMHLEFVGKPSPEKQNRMSRRDVTSHQRTTTNVIGFNNGDFNDNDSDKKEDLSDLPKVLVPDRRKFEAILMEHDPLVLQKCLLTSTVENQVLQCKLETATKKEIGLVGELDRTREENEDLKFQLEDKNIELEGTKARVRVLEQLQKPPQSSAPSPDVIPASESPPNHLERMSRSEITTASMKAMSPFPLTLQLDHSSSTESAHDQATNEAATRKSTNNSNKSKQPSKIPLKSYAAPKPPINNNSGNPSSYKSNHSNNSYKSGGNFSNNYHNKSGNHHHHNSHHHHHNNAPRSRSGDSLNRSHSAQSWRNNYKNNHGGGDLKDSMGASFNSGNGGLSTNSRGTLRKASSSATSGSITSSSSSSVRRSGSVRDSPSSSSDPSKVLNYPKEKFRYQWILSSFNNGIVGEFPDSLNDFTISMGENNIQHHQISIPIEFRSTSLDLVDGRFYDSIDSNSSYFYHQQEKEKEDGNDQCEKFRYFHSDSALNNSNNFINKNSAGFDKK
ncbi:probable basic-leucine zipper transcription factor L isoform X2 [Onthophagus taurus]|uniref:probable basic-leucine zipper transcription factor L isoform X2 n=1 Tax=Onthophagus taurus TaxID=166361 RepID=UPI0039BEB8A0